MDIVSNVVCINGIFRWTSHQQWCIPTKDSLPLWDEHYYNAEMFNDCQCVMSSIVKCLVTKIHKKRPGLAHIKKTFGLAAQVFFGLSRVVLNEIRGNMFFFFLAHDQIISIGRHISSATPASLQLTDLRRERLHFLFAACRRRLLRNVWI